jgi:hypothetical protein
MGAAFKGGPRPRFEYEAQHARRSTSPANIVGIGQ